MKTIGLLGGMSWQSTTTYYQLINTGVAQALGGLHSAKLLMHSVDFAEIEALQKTGDWDKCADILTAAAKGLENAGADLMLIGTNTMHKVAPQVQAGISVPLLHIADATAEVLVKKGIQKVGLLGTIYTMTENYYTGRLAARGIEVVLPKAGQMQEINDIIFGELCLGLTTEASKELYLGIIKQMAQKGCQAVVLGCTEIGLLIKPGEAAVPLYDTTEIHCEAAVQAALAD